MLYLKQEESLHFLEINQQYKVFSPPELNDNCSSYFLEKFNLLSKEKTHHIFIPFLELAKFDRPYEHSPKLFINFLNNVLEQKNIFLYILDCHTLIPPQYKNNVFNISPSIYLRKYIQSFNLKNALFISPDQGAKIKVKKLSNIFQVPYISFLKNRKNNTFTLLENTRDQFFKNKTCFIFDDMLDTGKTINGIIRKIEHYKVDNFVLYVTHVLKKDTLLSIANHKMCTRVITTNSICEEIMHPKIDFLMLRKS